MAIDDDGDDVICLFLAQSAERKINLLMCFEYFFGSTKPMKTESHRGAKCSSIVHGGIEPGIKISISINIHS